MHTARSLRYRGLCPEGSLSRRVSVWGLCTGGPCPGALILALLSTVLFRNPLNSFLLLCRGAKLLFVDGYKYSRKRVNKFGSVSWRCRVLGCHATITTTQEGEVLRLGRSGHTHLPNEKPPAGYEPENKPRNPRQGTDPTPSGYKPDNKPRKDSETEENRQGIHNHRQDSKESVTKTTNVVMETEPEREQPQPEHKETENEAYQEQGGERSSSETTEGKKCCSDLFFRKLGTYEARSL